MTTIHGGGPAPVGPTASTRPPAGTPAPDALTLLGMNSQSGNCFACSNPGFGQGGASTGSLEEGHGATAFRLTMKSFLG